MYCKHCNAQNDDDARFCSSCGAPLNDSAQQHETPLQGQYTPPQGQYSPPQGAYAPYQQPAYGAAPMEPSKPLSIALPIVALILGILSADIIGILLGAFALVNFNRYTDALRMGDIGSAEMYKAKSRRLATIGIIVTVVLFVLAMIVLIAGGVLLGVSLAENGGIDSPLVEFNYGGGIDEPPIDIPAMLQMLF
ncbi:MAG: zinc-ribbon domain-containing protein [Clostridia bacterium]|nr:zinc-ribbon domain-containing protein [Clostridia bacterium]